jgi:hypothetical protein
MTKIIGVISVVLLTLGATSPLQDSTTKPNAAAEKMLIANERALYQAVAKADKASFQSLAAAEGVWTTKTGFVPMSLLVDSLDTFTVTRWDIANPHVTWIDDNAAVVLYSRTGVGTFGEQPLAPTTLASTVWIRRGDKWRALHHQETDLTTN